MFAFSRHLKPAVLLVANCLLEVFSLLVLNHSLGTEFEQPVIK
jgi:hypothetical protein